MGRALELAGRGERSRVTPNPLVGAVIARGDETIGQGFHAELGGLHAERAALEDCRRPVHLWRAEADAIGVGIGTALADDPLLTAREGSPARQPARVVFDTDARLPHDSQLVRTVDRARLIVVAGPGAPAKRTKAL